MMRGFYNGVSGIKTQSFGMDVWSNNVANINNVGYKAALPEFKSIFYQSMVSAGNTPTTDQVGLGAVKQTTGLDFSLGGFQSTDETFDLAIGAEGFFGVKHPSGQTYYTRTGHFDIDAAGNLVDDSGNILLGTMTQISPITPTQRALAQYGLSSSGVTPQAYTIPKTDTIALANETAQTGINLPKFLYLPAEATTQVNFRGNLDSSIKTQRTDTTLDATSYTYNVDDTAKTISLSGKVDLSSGDIGHKSGDQVSIRVGDASGHFSDFTATLDSTGAWRLEAQNIKFLDTASLSVTANVTSEIEVPNTQKFTTDIFNADGSKGLITINLTKQIPQEREQTTWSGTATLTDEAGNVINSSMGELVFASDGTLKSNTLASVGGIGLNFGTDGQTLVYNGMTSTANARSDFSIVKDGFAEGLLKEYKVDESGHIIANFSNTRSFAIAKIALYHFQNDQGVAKIGDNLYEATTNSGAAFFYKNQAGENIYGSNIISGKLEMSNVDLAQALTEIIVIQKAYDASSKSITTSDEMIQTAIQMKQ